MDPLVPLSQSSVANINSKIAIYIVIILVCVIWSAFFSATETALTCSNRVRIKVKAENGSRTAKLVLKFLDKYDHSLITLLIGNNIVNNIASSLATVVGIMILVNEGLASVVSTIVMTLIIFIFGEVFPKNLAKNNPEKIISLFCYILAIFHIIFYPLMMILNFILWSIKKLLHIDKDENGMTEDEFQGIIETVEEEGGIDEEESDIIQAAVDFGDITVKDVFTPREKMSTIDIRRSSRKELMKYLENIEFSRIPVYDGNHNKIIGILHVRKFLKNAMKSRNFSIRAAITEPFFVKDSTKLDDMTEIFKKEKKHMALVKDDNNNVVGLVTMEDVLEELVGELNVKTPINGGDK